MSIAERGVLGIAFVRVVAGALCVWRHSGASRRGRLDLKSGGAGPAPSCLQDGRGCGRCGVAGGDGELWTQASLEPSGEVSKICVLAAEGS